jgi:mono/diheme cytochrome c family protein
MRLKFRIALSGKTLNAARPRLLPNKLPAALALLLALCNQAQASTRCPAEQETVQAPTNLQLCAKLEAVVRAPSALPLKLYEERLEAYLRNYCHRNVAAGWRSDKRVRDTGPFIASRQNGQWSGKSHGTHAPVIVWYSPEMMEWLKANRPEGAPASAVPSAAIPDGAMIIKEMYPEPAAACAGIDPSRLLPTQGAAVMVRDSHAAHDGWFWGWFGWKKEDWAPDWPAPASNAYPNMGFGQYCVNCHASARDNLTFSSLRNIKGEPGEPLVYLSQGLVSNPSGDTQHKQVTKAPIPGEPVRAPGLDTRFMSDIGLPGMSVPKRNELEAMPSESYDHVWARPKGMGLGGFLTSDQCLGCHDAGGTGLQFDTTEQGRDDKLVNQSSYGTWRSSPMGMAGRDPIFFAQVASEAESFHTNAKALVEDTCLGCHGILGQRRFKADAHAKSGICPPLSRAALDTLPFPTGDDPFATLAEYAGLARDGVSCVACHRMALGQEQATKVHNEPQNACLDERRALMTSGLSNFAASFSGSFDMGAANVLNGPFANPKQVPMNTALGIKPEHNSHIQSSEVCGTCHTVRLPILRDGAVIGHNYEQTTYAEWAFSDYRAGITPDGALPLGAGAQARSCQGCHMPSRDVTGQPIASKIASIQEYSNFPQTEYNLGPAEIDLPVREGIARHTLVGLNVFFIKMAQQFSALLGLRVESPMLRSKGADPLITTERAMLEQAEGATASVEVTDVKIEGNRLEAAVSVTNRTGHKFPSGVGFRRAFLEFVVRDDARKVLWASGGTNRAGVILGGKGEALASELWWQPDCSARIEPAARMHQPHYEIIESQDQAQIYEDLAAEPSGNAPRCAGGAENAGALTTSFLSRCAKVKDNRLLPAGLLKLEDRVRIAAALGADRDLAEESGPHAVGDDPDYQRGGGDTVRYRVPVAELAGKPASVEATLYYQATPPYYLQDRICTSRSADTKRLAFLVANLDLANTPAQSWKLKVAATRAVPVP